MLQAGRSRGRDPQAGVGRQGDGEGRLVWTPHYYKKHSWSDTALEHFCNGARIPALFNCLSECRLQPELSLFGERVLKRYTPCCQGLVKTICSHKELIACSLYTRNVSPECALAQV